VDICAQASTLPLMWSPRNTSLTKQIYAPPNVLATWETCRGLPPGPLGLLHNTKLLLLPNTLRCTHHVFMVCKLFSLRARNSSTSITVGKLCLRRKHDVLEVPTNVRVLPSPCRFQESTSDIHQASVLLTTEDVYKSTSRVRSSRDDGSQTATGKSH